MHISAPHVGLDNTFRLRMQCQLPTFKPQGQREGWKDRHGRDPAVVHGKSLISNFSSRDGPSQSI